LRTALAAGLLAAVLAGCAGASDPGAQGSRGSGLEGYVRRVEPIRLGVNRLLDRADPILSAYAEHKLSPAAAERRMDALERRFADYAVRIAALRPVPAAIASEQRAYAHTFVLEDSYLSALTEAVPKREFGELPDTQDRQRAAIIAWRTRLEVLAERRGISLPRDLQVAGRGEIAPSPLGE
jgi:hypothetical protein